jgi:DNA-binding transcriptional regulator/RsmH inhibitor MraZ
LADGDDIQGLFGTFDAKVDLNSGRVTLSTDLTLLKGKQVMITTEPLKRYLEVRSLPTFNRFQERLLAKADELPIHLANALRSNYLGSAALAQVDNNFRLVLPKRTRDFLGNRGDVFIIGVGDCLQVWPADRWAAVQADLEKALVENYEAYATEIHRTGRRDIAPATQGAI